MKNSDDRRNPFAHLKHYGTKGSVVNRDYESITLISSMAESIVIYLAQIDYNIWDYGFLHTFPDGSSEKKYPGEGSSWFTSSRAALLYTLGLASTVFKPDSPNRLIIDQRIKALTNPSLFD